MGMVVAEPRPRTLLTVRALTNRQKSIPGRFDWLAAGTDIHSKLSERTERPRRPELARPARGSLRSSRSAGLPGQPRRGVLGPARPARAAVVDLAVHAPRGRDGLRDPLDVAVAALPTLPVRLEAAGGDSLLHVISP